jgi:hypothetical protein
VKLPVLASATKARICRRLGFMGKSDK